MSTTTPLTDAINALTTYANETTGASDTDLSSAVATLVAGYGSGGSSYDFADHAYPQGAITTSQTTIIAQTFRQRTGITSFVGDSVTNIYGYAFYGCTALQTVSVPNCTQFGASDIFNGCTSLVGIVLPSITQALPGNIFSGCTSLAYADFGSGFSKFNGTTAFNNCSSLTTIIFRNTSVVTLNNVNNFTGTPFASGGSGGTIYVPSDLISSYQEASNWSTVDGYGTITWAAIEGSTYETQYADGTAIS